MLWGYFDIVSNVHFTNDLRSTWIASSCVLKCRFGRLFWACTERASWILSTLYIVLVSKERSRQLDLRRTPSKGAWMISVADDIDMQKFKDALYHNHQRFQIETNSDGLKTCRSYILHIFCGRLVFELETWKLLGVHSAASLCHPTSCSSK